MNSGPESGDSLMAGSTTVFGIIRQAATRPRLLGGLLRAAWRFRARGWWRRPPFLPIPPREYVEWRMHTAYGDGGSAPSVDELGRYVRWANRLYRDRGKGVQS